MQDVPWNRIEWDVVIRQVEETGYVRYETNLYRVPDDEQIGELVYLCIGLERIEIFDRGVHRWPSTSEHPPVQSASSATRIPAGGATT